MIFDIERNNTFYLIILIFMIFAVIRTNQRCFLSLNMMCRPEHLRSILYNFWIKWYFGTHISPWAPCDLKIAVVHIVTLVKFWLIVQL